MAQAARDLEVGEGSLREWVKQSQGATTRGLSTPLNGPVGETERSELIRLRREVTTLRMERDFLKKAAAFFAKESR
jgi:transposase